MLLTILYLKKSCPRKESDKLFNYGMQAYIVKLEHLLTEDWNNGFTHQWQNRDSATWQYYRPRSHVSVFIWKRNDFRPHVSDVKGHRKRNLFENALQGGIFWKTPFSCFPVWQKKTELFENDDVSVLDPAYLRERKWRKMVILRSALHKAAMKYTRMPKACAKVLY